jgi:hypothetical protein
MGVAGLGPDHKLLEEGLAGEAVYRFSLSVANTVIMLAHGSCLRDGWEGSGARSQSCAYIQWHRTLLGGCSLLRRVQVRVGWPGWVR